MTNTERERIYNEVIEHYGVENQLNVVQEELAELIVAISKYKRCKSTKTLNNIIEEIADCHIMINQLRLMLPISLYEVNMEINYKLNRQQQRIKEEK